MISAVIWDLGGVLCRFEPEARTAAIAAAAGRSAEEVDAVLTPALRATLDRGDLDSSGLQRSLRGRLGWECSFADLARAWVSAFPPDEEVLDLALQVTVPQAILTNNGPPLSDSIRWLLPGVARVTDLILFSADLGLAKPHPRSFLAACHRLGLAPAETLMIDDSPEHVAAARQAGLAAIQFVSPIQLRGELVALGLLNHR